MNNGLISAVMVIEDQIIARSELVRLIETLEKEWIEVELILVANAPSTALSLKLKQLVTTLPDCTCYFLPQRIDKYAAFVVGIDNAVGDHLFVTGATAAECAALPKMIEAIRAGFDLAYAEPLTPLQHRGHFLYRGFRRLFYAGLNLLSDVQLSPDLPLMRLMTRSAALHLTGQLNAELLLRARTLGPGFPAVSVPALLEELKSQPASFANSVTRGLRGIVTTSAAPLRLASLLGLASAVASLLYTLYVIGVFFIKADVAPGWTTLSLQIAGMMLLLSSTLALIAEYVLQIHSRMPLRRRAVVMRELKSPLSRRAGATNVIAKEGLVIGMPSEFFSSNSI